MVQGSSSLPGGIAAWLPSVCFIIIESHLQARREALRTGRYSDEVNLLRQMDKRSSSSENSTGVAGSSGAACYEFEPDSDAEEQHGVADRDDGGAADALFDVLQPDLGMSLASAILVILRGFDRYVRWHDDIRRQPDTDDQPGREQLALKCAVSAVDMIHYLEDGSNSCHKSWMPHII
eukprot:784776-Pleurochrysis_carterae.AAC.1